MTITPHYIRKCEMAEEIQAMRAPMIDGAVRNYDGSMEVPFSLMVGDFFACKHLGVDNFIETRCYGDTSVLPVIYRGTPENVWSVHLQYSKDLDENAVVDKIIWLPRLDQLFYIANGVEISANKAFIFMAAENKEEILLTVIMRNKFGKKWNGENWESVK